MPSTIGKCKLFKIKHTTLLEGSTFFRNKHKIPFFLNKVHFFLVEKKTPSEFVPEFCWEEIAEEIFFFQISLWCQIWDTKPAFTSNKPTHYLLDYGNLSKIYIRREKQALAWIKIYST